MLQGSGSGDCDRWQVRKNCSPTSEPTNQKSYIWNSEVASLFSRSDLHYDQIKQKGLAGTKGAWRLAEIYPFKWNPHRFRVALDLNQHICVNMTRIYVAKVAPDHLKNGAGGGPKEDGVDRHCESKTKTKTMPWSRITWQWHRLSNNSAASKK